MASFEKFDCTLNIKERRYLEDILSFWFQKRQKYYEDIPDQKAEVRVTSTFIRGMREDKENFTFLDKFRGKHRCIVVLRKTGTTNFG